MERKMYTKIVGTGSYLPKKVLTNDDIAQLVDTNDEWIRERTGIQSRHIVEDETTVTMASMAAKDALENGVAMVHQELNQCLERSVIDNMFLGRYPKNSLGMIDEGRMRKYLVQEMNTAL